jgi:hypothetical protein
MPREGTRSATGNSKPRVFQTIDTAPTIKRTTKPKPKTSTTAVPTAKGAKPTGITKKKAPAPKAKKDSGGAKVRLISQ